MPFVRSISRNFDELLSGQAVNSLLLWAFVIDFSVRVEERLEDELFAIDQFPFIVPLIGAVLRFSLRTRP
jgi:hypothetical protein